MGLLCYLVLLVCCGMVVATWLVWLLLLGWCGCCYLSGVVVATWVVWLLLLGWCGCCY